MAEKLKMPEPRRKELFAALVAAQDGGLTVAASREKVASENAVSVEDVRTIEQEGLTGQWPPFDA